MDEELGGEEAREELSHDGVIKELLAKDEVVPWVCRAQKKEMLRTSLHFHQSTAILEETGAVRSSSRTRRQLNSCRTTRIFQA